MALSCFSSKLVLSLNISQPDSNVRLAIRLQKTHVSLTKQHYQNIFRAKSAGVIANDGQSESISFLVNDH